MKQTLLCTFVHRNETDKTAEYIFNNYKCDKVFLLSSKLHGKLKYYCTFAISGQYNLLPNTIAIHRRSETNTYYTINALNKTIQAINNGVLDKNYQIDWEYFTDTLMYIQSNELIRVAINLEHVYE